MNHCSHSSGTTRTKKQQENIFINRKVKNEIAKIWSYYTHLTNTYNHGQAKNGQPRKTGDITLSFNDSKCQVTFTLAYDPVYKGRKNNQAISLVLI